MPTVFYLIERQDVVPCVGTRTVWLNADARGRDMWTEDHKLATHYYGRDEADAAVKSFGLKNVEVTEHKLMGEFV